MASLPRVGYQLHPIAIRVQLPARVARLQCPKGHLEVLRRLAEDDRERARVAEELSALRQFRQATEARVRGELLEVELGRCYVRHADPMDIHNTAIAQRVI